MRHKPTTIQLYTFTFAMIIESYGEMNCYKFIELAWRNERFSWPVCAPGVTNDFPIPGNTKFYSGCHRFAEIPVPCHVPPNWPQLGVRADAGCRKRHQPNETLAAHSFLFDLYTQYMPVLHRLATIHDEGCYSIGGLKITHNSQCVLISYSSVCRRGQVSKALA